MQVPFFVKVALTSFLGSFLLLEAGCRPCTLPGLVAAESWPLTKYDRRAKVMDPNQEWETKMTGEEIFRFIYIRTVYNLHADKR